MQAPDSMGGGSGNAAARAEAAFAGAGFDTLDEPVAETIVSSFLIISSFLET